MISKRFPWPMLASIYISQYIGIAFILSAAVAILRQQGVPLDKLALLNLAMLPLAGKVFYAPLIDKYRCFFQGQYRSWLIVAQAGMTLLLILTGMMNLEHQFSWIFAALLFYMFFMSVQDVSVDGLSCKLFDADSRKWASSIQFSGNLLGNIIGGGLILMLYPWLHWHGSLWVLAGLTSISLMQIVLFTEPEQSATKVQHIDSGNLLRDVYHFIKSQRRWFMLLAIYPIGFTSGFAILTPLLIDAGWQLGEVGFITKVFGSAIGVVSALFATAVITRLGRIKALLTITLTQALGLAFIIPITMGYTDKLTVYTAVTIYFIGFPALLVTLSTMIMDKAAVTHRKATFFTLQFSLVSLMGFIYSAISMALAKYVGYSIITIAGVLLTLAVAMLAWLILERKNRDDKYQNINIESSTS
ncbi:MFS transporter [Pseudoalteromonas arctica]|uniref:MFS transporter n=1 Tax=Pseudoalteromonas arctica TaxID=394751 RepID=A0A7Y0HC21_9GAMM|nr:MFS transporter [Pseudoalteromonas arctica]NMM39609.1 MFS transporter [Pseudoalteromonas arctica]